MFYSWVSTTVVAFAMRYDVATTMGNVSLRLLFQSAATTARNTRAYLDV